MDIYREELLILHQTYRLNGFIVFLWKYPDEKSRVALIQIFECLVLLTIRRELGRSRCHYLYWCTPSEMCMNWNVMKIFSRVINYMIHFNNYIGDSNFTWIFSHMYSSNVLNYLKEFNKTIKYYVPSWIYMYIFSGWRKIV